MLNKSYALYETKKDYNVIKGEVPDFGYDVKLAIMVDGVKKTDMPTSPLGKDGKYYDVKVSCTSSKTTGLWDYNAWRLNLDYIESNSKCTLTFTSSMTKDQYDEYIKSGVALRRNTYRGKDITSLWQSGDLYTQISNGTFADIYVGDYIVSTKTDTSNKKIVWLIADLDNYLNLGDGITLTKHHATIIPAYQLQGSKMNSTNTTVGGYVGSDMYKTILPKVLSTYIEPDFTKNNVSHVIEYGTRLSNIMTAENSNMHGTDTGASSEWTPVKRKLDLMSEVNVFGTIIMSSSGYDVGIDNKQYAIFQLRPELAHQDLAGNSYYYWLKAVASSLEFANSTSSGLASAVGAATESGVRPRFLIG